MNLLSAALTDVGRVRERNEDAFLRSDYRRLYGVADGVGGMPGGAEAANTAVGYVHDALVRRTIEVGIQLIDIVRDASAAVQKVGRSLSPKHGIATTLTFGLFLEKRALIAHVGDSRCYRLREGGIEQLTRDHTVENEARRLGRLRELEKLSERQRQAIARCVGQPDLLQTDIIEQRLQPGDLFLFVTDGVTRVLQDEELALILHAPDPLENRLAMLIERVLERGAPDNATAVLVQVEP